MRRNIAANIIGSGWQALMGLVFVPFYILFMGVESYGLVGIFTILQALSGFLDLGLSATLTREIARLSVLPGKDQEMRDLVRSMEIIYWSLAGVIGVIIVGLSPVIAHDWVQTGRLSSGSVEQAIRIMGCSVALQWPAALYSGGLQGLQRQVLLNVVVVVVSTLRGAGSLLVLWAISPTVQAFFLWQIVVSLLNSSLLAHFLWDQLPRTERHAVFRKNLLLGVWRFAAGMSGISILAIALTQMDKIILSKMLSLEAFGYYMLAGVVAASLGFLTLPVFSAIYPRFTQLVSIEDWQGLKRLYHRSCQFVSILILPVTVVIALFSYEILLLWTQSEATAGKASTLVSILISGTSLNGIMSIPFALQLAYGWTRLTLTTNLAAILLVIPLIILMTREYGASGGASVWLMLNVGYVLLTVHWMHRRLLPGEKWRWYRQDVALPLLASLAVAGTGRLVVHAGQSPAILAVGLAGILFLSAAAASFAAPASREWISSRVPALARLKGRR